MTENSELHILQAMQDSGPGMKGGYTTYGQDIGILMMRTVFPRLPGDIGNARSFRVPVRYRIVDVDPLNLTEKNADSQLIRPFIEAAQELGREGCRAITTSCSFLGGFQRRLADAVHVPVFTSTLLLVPIVYNMLSRERKIGILTESQDILPEAYFNQAGWSSRQIPVCITGQTPDSAFSKLIIGDNAEGNRRQILECITEMTERHMREHPDTGALVLECTNYAPFAGLIRAISGVPVFSIIDLVEFIDRSLNPPGYR